MGAGRGMTTNQHRRRRSLARVYVAVLTERRPTVRSVAERCCLSVGYTHKILSDLRDLGAVSWDADRSGTLHATMIPTPPPHRSER